MTSHQKDQVAILMCTYNGEKFIRQQLQSFLDQEYQNWKLYISDDGSTDNTKIIIQEFRKKLGKNKISLRDGPRRGFAQNFLSLCCDVTINTQYYAFSDQDDIWCSYKLKRAIYLLQNHTKAMPALYCSRTRIIDSKEYFMGMSPLRSRPPTFKNALLESIAGGNTMVFNKAARDIIANVGDKISIVSHDWWIYLLVSGSGGHIHYDSNCTIWYRQHKSNLVGSNISIISKLSRFIGLCSGRFREWNAINFQCLDASDKYLNNENKRVLAEYRRVHLPDWGKRLKGYNKSGVYRQSRFESVIFMFMACLSKL